MFTVGHVKCQHDKMAARKAANLLSKSIQRASFINEYCGIDFYWRMWRLRGAEVGKN